MHIHIFWDSLSPPGLQIPVTRNISSIIGVPASVSENHVRMMGYVDGRKQINAPVFLDSIQSYKHRHALKDPLLLVVHQDLFNNGNSFVFGLARQSVGAAVVSTARLGNEYYGREGNDDDLIDRITKEGGHEVGHLLALITALTGNASCLNPTLSMNWIGRKRCSVKYAVNGWKDISLQNDGIFSGRI